MFTDKYAFTAVELMVVVSLSFIILIMISNSFFQNIYNIKDGESINSAEFEKFMIWKNISIYLNRLQCRYSLKKEGYMVAEKAKLEFSGKTGDGYTQIRMIDFSFPDGVEKEIVYKIEGKEIKRIRDGDEYTISSQFGDGLFKYNDNSFNLSGIISILTERTKNEYKIPIDFRFEIDKRNVDVLFE